MVKERIRSAILDWSTDKTFRLITLVEERPCLWDTQSTQYRDRAVRDKAWEEVANEFQYPKVEVICKWNLLRQQFRNAHNKYLERVETGRISSRTPNQFYTAMSFMTTVFLNDKDTNESYTDPLLLPRKVEDISADDMTLSNDIKYFENNFETSTASSDVQRFVPAKRKKLTKQAVKESIPSPTISNHSLVPANERDEDEFDLWGRYLAATLRNYPDKIAIRKFKAAVSLSLAKLESGEFDVLQNS